MIIDLFDPAQPGTDSRFYLPFSIAGELSANPIFHKTYSAFEKFDGSVHPLTCGQATGSPHLVAVNSISERSNVAFHVQNLIQKPDHKI